MASLGGDRSVRAQRGGAVKSVIGFLLGLAVLSMAALAAGGYYAYHLARSPGPLVAETVLLIPSGASVSSISKSLAEAGVVEHPELFIAAVRLKGVQSRIKAGEYKIPAGASVLEVIDLLIEGKSILYYFTAPEGLTTDQILRLLAADETLVGDITSSPGEGELLPETYAFTRGETRDGVIARMMKDQDALVDKLWPERALELPFATPAEALILASIVEKETGVAEERPRIAAVFVNRLKRGMRLESDPTIIYGLTKGEPLGRGLRQSELRSDTPYNTYVIRGLPPTPIANPGRESIAAVLNPMDTDDIFFVADGTGGHAFASNLKDHEANVAKWRQVEKARAAKAKE